MPEWETRSPKVEAVKPINDQLERLVELLENIADDQDEYSVTRSDAVQLLHRILNFECFDSFLVLEYYTGQTWPCSEKV
jgi:hypothetical protein